jgi:hypothetical protein
MAVYTDVSDDDLATFVARYDIGEPINLFDSIFQDPLA